MTGVTKEIAATRHDAGFEGPKLDAALRQQIIFLLLDAPFEQDMELRRPQHPWFHRRDVVLAKLGIGEASFVRKVKEGRIK